MRKNKIIIFLFVVILFIFIFFILSGRKKIDYIKIRDNKINIEIVNTDETRYKGLSGRENLCADCGMLFVFNDLRERYFVMRDMNFPLDIIWIKENRVIKIDKNLSPEGHNPVNIYSPSEPIDMVLEVNGGFCDRKGIKEGEEIKIRN
ncbi:MAG: DUF192 domain-containing protein [bacterium]